MNLMPTDPRHEQARLKNTILISMIIVPLIPMVLILSIGYYYFSTSVQTSTTESMKRIITDHGLMIERFLNERQSDLEMVLDTHRFEDLQNPDRLKRVFDALQRKSAAFADLGIFDENGLHVAYRGPYSLSGKIYKDMDWFQKVMADGTYVSDIFLGYRDVPHFIIAIARGEAGHRWVIRATIDTPLFTELVKRVRIGTTGEAYIIDAQGVLQTDRRSGGNLMEPSPDRELIPKAEGPAQSFITRDETGKKFLYTTWSIKNGAWRLVVRREVADAFAGLRSTVYLTLLTMVVGGAAILLLAFYLTNRILQRIEKADTEKKQLNEQLIRASRLAELGQMAAGVAHEINNPLQIIKSEQMLIEMNFEDLKKAGHLPPSDALTEVEESFQQIKQQINRCAEITQAVLKFGRQSKPQVEAIALQQFVPEIIGMVAKKASVHGVDLQQQIPDGVPTISADPGQLQQVLVNLLNNALDAVVARYGSAGGAISVEASRKEGDRVIIAVQDNGSGISPDNLEKIFAPFFTTKPPGKGTGLGLSVCYGIINQLGGAMSVSSRLGEGTTFTIELPAAKAGTTN
jgi:two-component system NtrC family sensor kinase